MKTHDGDYRGSIHFNRAWYAGTLRSPFPLDIAHLRACHLDGDQLAYLAGGGSLPARQLLAETRTYLRALAARPAPTDTYRVAIVNKGTRLESVERVGMPAMRAAVAEMSRRGEVEVANLDWADGDDGLTDGERTEIEEARGG